MKTQTNMRRAYSWHFLRCVLLGVDPLSFSQFARMAARIRVFGA